MDLNNHVVHLIHINVSSQCLFFLGFLYSDLAGDSNLLMIQ